MLTDQEKKNLREAGADFAGDWLFDNKTTVGFCGGECFDMAKGYQDIEAPHWDSNHISAAADYIYEGMMDEIKKAQSMGIEAYLKS